MKTVNVQIAVPEGMIRYITEEGHENSFERNAMILYPFIQPASKKTPTSTIRRS